MTGELIDLNKTVGAKLGSMFFGCSIVGNKLKCYIDTDTPSYDVSVLLNEIAKRIDDIESEYDRYLDIAILRE